MVSPAGRTDGEIARLLLLGAGVSAEQIDDGASAVREACTRLYAELCPPSLADKVVPGIPALLEWLAGRDDVRLSLVTGNYEPVARLKLARAGIGGTSPAVRAASDPTPRIGRCCPRSPGGEPAPTAFPTRGRRRS